MVVLPTPFTPTIKITKGLELLLTWSGTSQGSRIICSSTLRACKSSLGAESCLRSSCCFNREIIWSLASIPTSAESNRVSISSKNSASIVFSPWTNVSIASPSLPRVRLSPEIKREKKTGFLFSGFGFSDRAETFSGFAGEFFEVFSFFPILNIRSTLDTIIRTALSYHHTDSGYINTR